MEYNKFETWVVVHIFFVIFLYANGRMILGLFSIDVLVEILCVCCILAWFKPKITTTKDN